MTYAIFVLQIEERIMIRSELSESFVDNHFRIRIQSEDQSVIGFICPDQAQSVFQWFLESVR